MARSKDHHLTSFGRSERACGLMWETVGALER